METTSALTPTETARRAELQAAHDANRAAWNRITKAPHTCATPEQAAEIDAEAPFTNEQRAELETLNFRADAPAGPTGRRASSKPAAFPPNNLP